MSKQVSDLFKHSGITVGEDQESNIDKLAELVMAECLRTIDTPPQHSYNWATKLEDLPEPQFN